jgi:DNA-binding NarL/FixJ family response regulator
MVGSFDQGAWLETSTYWMKSGASEELIRSIETVLSGELYFSPRVAHLAVRTLLDAPRWNDSPTGGLTDRELHVYGLIGAGFVAFDAVG